MYLRTVRILRTVIWGAAMALFAAGCATQAELSKNQARQTSSDPEILQIVKELGKDENNGFNRNVENFKRLARSPILATALLINELETIDLIKLQEKGNNLAEVKKGWHVVWCLRGLYFLTGERFCAPTKYKFTDSELDDNRAGLIYENHSSKKVNFFVEWMSRGTIYFAPTDAQRNIIRQWQAWYQKHGSTHRYHEDSNFDDWYFGRINANGKSIPDLAQYQWPGTGFIEARVVKFRDRRG